jgi:SAM-dependent methyltransferase
MSRQVLPDVKKERDDALEHEYALIEEMCQSLAAPIRFVEVGCGALGLLGRKGHRLASLYDHSIGMDIDEEGLRRNRQIRHPVCASGYSLPLKSNAVDIIVCRWVFEHLDRPGDSMREFARVLRKGGFVYIKTSNLLNYAMLISWITPLAFHNWARSLGSLSGRRDNTATFYRANTQRALRALARESGFEVKRMECHPHAFMYYSFNRWLFHVMRNTSRIAHRISDRFHLKIVCVLQKV